MVGQCSRAVGGADFDAIVVLGTRVLAGGRPSPALARRIDHAIRLYHQGFAEHLLLSGGLGAEPPAEAEVMRALAVDAGVPAARIVLETGSTSTFENALMSAALLHERRWSRVLVVSDGYHLPRALLVFRRLGLDARGDPVPEGRGDKAARLRTAMRLREAGAWPWYLYRLYIRDRRRIAQVRRGRGSSPR